MSPASGKGPLSSAIAAREAARRATGEASERPAHRRRAREDPGPERDLGPAADPESVARTILLDQLTGRARSRADLATALRKREVPDEIATALLDRFEEVGLIDDAGYARDWVAQRQQGRGLARRALAHELRRKGIDDETAGDALDQIDPDDEVEAARAQVRRKLRSMRSLDREVATRRLVGMLARKGHSPGTAYRVVKDELDAAGWGRKGDPGDPDDTIDAAELLD